MAEESEREYDVVLRMSVSGKDPQDAIRSFIREANENDPKRGRLAYEVDGELVFFQPPRTDDVNVATATEATAERTEGESCQHRSGEDCMTCHACGKCREDLDCTDTCGDCGGHDCEAQPPVATCSR